VKKALSSRATSKARLIYISKKTGEPLTPKANKLRKTNVLQRPSSVDLKKTRG